MKYRQIIQELRESHDMNVQLFLYYAEKIIKLLRKVKKENPQVDRFEWVRNGQGIRVKKCCASCAHKDLTRAVTKRYCSISGNRVDPLDVCVSWEMSDQMKVAGLLQ